MLFTEAVPGTYVPPDSGAKVSLGSLWPALPKSEVACAGEYRSAGCTPGSALLRSSKDRLCSSGHLRCSMARYRVEPKDPFFKGSQPGALMLVQFWRNISVRPCMRSKSSVRRIQKRWGLLRNGKWTWLHLGYEVQPSFHNLRTRRHL